MRRVARRWRTSFAQFISDRTVEGVRLGLLKHGIQVTQKGIYGWVSGASTPPTRTAAALVRMSGGRIGLPDILRQRQGGSDGRPGGGNAGGGGARAVAESAATGDRR